MDDDARPPASRYSDTPISVPSEDLLERDGYAKNLAKLLIASANPRNVVIGITGDWGSGKSSLMNLIIRHLESHQGTNGKTPIYSVFNPWSWSGHERVADILFQQIEDAMRGDSYPWYNPKGWSIFRKNTVTSGGTPMPRGSGDTRVARRLRKYGANLGIYKDLPVSRKLAYVVFGALLTWGIIDLPTIIGLIQAPAVQIGLWILGLLLLAAGAIQTFTGSLAAWFEASSTVSSKSVLEAREELHSLLKKRAQPIVIFIDDIDRLTRDEIRLLFQVLRMNLDLPYVTFALFFQQRTVEEALSESSNLDPSNGRKYLEKLVPVRIDLTPITRSQLKKVITEYVDEIVARVTQNAALDSRWGVVFNSGIQPMITTLRAAKRFAGSLSFHLELYNIQGSFQVNPVDAIALESLRAFEPTLYSRLGISRQLLLGTGSMSDQERGVALQTLLSNASADGRAASTTILTLLFPKAAIPLGVSPQNLMKDAEMFRDRCVAHDRMFNLYFELALADDSISVGEIHELIGRSADSDSLLAIFESMKDANRIDAFRDILEAHEARIPEANNVELFVAMMSFNDQLFPVSEPYNFGEDIILRRLDRIKDMKQRGEIMKEVLSVTTSLFSVVAFVARQAYQNQQGASHLSLEWTDRLRELALDRIRKAAGSDLARRPGLWHIFSMWEQWANLEEVQDWVDKTTVSPDQIVPLLSGMVTTSQVFDGRAWTRHSIDSRHLSRYISLEKLDQRIDKLEGLTEKEQEIVNLYKNHTDSFGERVATATD